MKFTVNAEGGASQHPRNLARALERLAAELDRQSTIEPQAEPLEGVLRDVRGAVFGTWRYEP